MRADERDVLGAIVLTGRRGAFASTGQRILTILANQAAGTLRVRQLVQEARDTAMRDGLTALYNRRAFEKHLDQLVAAVRQRHARVILITHATGFADPSWSGDADALNAWRAILPRPSGMVLLDFERAARERTLAVARKQDVLAAADPFTLEGHLLIVDHGMGLNSAFLHSSELLVREGERVTQGQPLGKIGMTGRATGPHLHWSLMWRGLRLDPLLFVPPRG